MQRIRKSGPENTIRPFIPSIDLTDELSTEEKQLETLESIAVSLAAIDHNLERLTIQMTNFANSYMRRP